MKQLKLGVIRYKYDVVIETDYSPTRLVESFEHIDGANKFVEDLERSGVNGKTIKIIKR